MKKIIALLLTVVLTATVAIGGTVAYLQDSARNDNTMTMGKVDISQWEYEREKNADGTYKTSTIDSVTSYVLKGFTQDKMLLPATEINADGTPNNYGAGGWDDITVRMTQVGSFGGMQVFESPNAVDKFVTVKNDGNTGAYVRTLVAVEVGSGNADLLSFGTRTSSDENSTAPWLTASQLSNVTINGNTYSVFEYVYKGASDVNRHVNGVLTAGEMTYPNLCQVFLKSTATNDDITKLDGNSNGKLDILVLSQAVQADGWTAAAGKSVALTALDAAFGDVTASTVAEWFAADGE